MARVFPRLAARRFSTSPPEQPTRRQEINSSIVAYGKWLLPLAGIFTIVTVFVPNDVTVGELLGTPVRPEAGFDSAAFPALAASGEEWRRERRAKKDGRGGGAKKDGE
jgi:hypothetical protein